MNAPKVHGLILAGGTSQRLGSDKAELVYHDKPQIQYIYELLNSLISEVYISVSKVENLKFKYQQIQDNCTHIKGPLNGVLSAHKKYPNAAWLVFAVDMPFVTGKTIQKLIINRNPTCLATAYTKKDTKQPEPLAAIWEPEGLRMILDTWKETDGKYPSEFLKDNLIRIKLIQPKDDIELKNVNSMEEFKSARDWIG